MPSLREVQRRLKTVFTHPRGVTAGLTAAGFGAPRKPVTRLIADQPPVPLHTRLAVYSDGYFLRLLDTLGQDFAAVKRAAGTDLFQKIIADYLLRHPSRSPLINDAGAAFAAFLKGHLSAKRLPFLSELASLEWAALQTLFMDRWPPAAPDAFAVLEPGSRLRLDPTVKLFRTRWAVDLLREKRALPAGEKLRRPIAPSPRRLLLYRDDVWVRVEHLDEREFDVLEGLSVGKTLERALRSAGEGVTAARVRGWFSRWTRDGVVKGLL